MIAKHIAKRRDGKSSITRLVKYCQNDQGKASRVGETWCANCGGTNDPLVAARLMEMTQLLNSRAKGDKTYHLMISFRAGETPSRAEMEAIEREMCEALGFGGHQRVAVVHRDTDDWHIHVAINAIDPETHTIHAPYNDYDVIANKCAELERRFFLERDRHKGDTKRPKTQSESHIHDMIRQNGAEPLAEWVKRECLDDMKAAKTWEEFVAVCAKNGLEYKPRGNGAVFVAGETTVKASTIDRELSKAQLEKRLGGAFPGPGPEGKGGERKPVRVYERKPKDRDETTTRMYARYLQERDSGLDERKDLLRAARSLRYRAAQERYHSAMLLSRSLFGSAKREAIEAAKKRKEEEYQKIRDDMAAEFQKCRRKSWVAWLKEQAERNADAEALALLRRRAYGLAMKNALGGAGAEPGGALDALDVDGKPVAVDAVTKQGTVLYDVGGEVVRDNGKGFYCYGQTNQETLVMMLKMTAKRYGSVIDVSGDEVFRSRCVKAAVDARLRITFKDARMEAERLAGVTPLPAPGKTEAPEPRPVEAAARQEPSLPTRPAMDNMTPVSGLSNDNPATGINKPATAPDAALVDAAMAKLFPKKNDAKEKDGGKGKEKERGGLRR